jgi:hypothetical protein
MSLLDFNLPASDPSNPNSTLLMPAQIARQQAVADALSKSGSDTSPIASPWQGAARIAQALSAALINRNANQQLNLGRANNDALQASAFGLDPGSQAIPATPGRTTPALSSSDAAVDAQGDAEAGLSGPAAIASALGGAGAAPGASPGAGASAVASALGGSDPLAPYRAAIAGNESGGNYSSLGPVVASGQYAGQQALGKYGVMPGNLPEWSVAAVGRPVSPQEFLANPQLQDAIFNHQFGSLLQTHSPQDAASIWLTGKTLAGGGAGAADQLGSTGQAYADKFTSQLSPAAAAINASAPAPGQPAPSGAGGPMAHAADGTPVATNAQGYAIDPSTGQPTQGAPAPGPQGGAYANAGAVAWRDPTTGQVVTGPKGTPIPANALPIAGTNPPGAPAPPPGAPAPPSPQQIAQLSAAMGGAPAPAAQPSAGVVAGASAPAGPQPGGAPTVPPAASAPIASSNRQALLQLLADPYTPPALAQVAEAQLAATTPTPPEFKTIKDSSGAEIPVWVSPKTGQVTPINVPGAGGFQSGGPALAPLPGGPAPPSAGGVPVLPGGPPAAGVPAPGASVAPLPPNPTGQTNAPLPQTVAGSVDMGAANGLTPQGAAYLDAREKQGGVDSVVARAARAIINGNDKLPEGNAATKSTDIAIRDAVFRAAPTYNSSVAQARMDMVKQFGDKTSPTSAGGMILSANTALHHLNALADSADSLGNTGYPVVNAVKNEGREIAVGNPALQAYQFNKNALSDEIAKIYKGGTPAEGEIKAMVANLSPNMTPDEQKAVFSKVSTLLQGKTDELQRQWQTAFGPNSSYPVIGGEGQKIIQRFAAPAPGAASAAPGAIPAISSPSDPAYAALPPGAQYKRPDGSVWTKK